MRIFMRFVPAVLLVLVAVSPLTAGNRNIQPASAIAPVPSEAPDALLSRASQAAADENAADGSLGFYAKIPGKTVLIGLKPESDTKLERAKVLDRLAAKSGVDRDLFTYVDYHGGMEESTIPDGDRLANSAGYCSMGAWGYRWFGTLQVPVLVTAAHCDNSLRHWSHDPWYNMDVEWNGANVDAQSMVPASGFGEYTNDVLGTGVIIGEGVPGGAFDVSGHPVCKSGATTGYTCGQLVTNDGGCRGHTGMRMATYNSSPGDSGGAVVTGTFPDVALLGFHEGTCAFTWDGTTIIWRQYTWHGAAKYILSIAGWYM